MHCFFGYMVFLYDQIKKDYIDLRKTPFQIIPQYAMKVRSITIGKEQLVGIIQRLARLGKLGTDFPFLPGEISPVCAFKTAKIDRMVEVIKDRKRRLEDHHGAPSSKRHKITISISKLEDRLLKQRMDLEKHRSIREKHRSKIAALEKNMQEDKSNVQKVKALREKYNCSSFVDVTRDQWLQFYPKLVRHFFQPPDTVKKHWTGVVTTDGIKNTSTSYTYRSTKNTHLSNECM
jgi:hypothetical protein